MINLKIKTLDSNDHHFSVEDGITVSQLKDKILEQMGVEIHRQRLIFCGRVLQDEKKLAEYDVDGKVIHMVERAPPSVEARELLRSQERANERDSDRERDSIFLGHVNMAPEPISLSPIHFNHVTQQQIRRLVSLAASAQGIEIEDQPGLDLSPTAARLEFLRRLIAEIRDQIDELIRNESDEVPNYPDDDEEDLRSSLAEARIPNEEIDPTAGTSRHFRGAINRTSRPAYHTPPENLGDIVADLRDLHDEFRPFREQYIMTLHDASDREIRLDEETLQRRQRNAELSAALFHSFSHAYHLLSDVGLLLSHGNSRLTSEALLRNPFPSPAQISVVHSSMTRRPLNTAGNAPATQTSETQPQQSTSQPGTQTSNDTSLTDETLDSSTRDSQEQSDQNSSENRANTLSEFENLFRGLGQAGALGGVEVVMSMEELPEGGPRNSNNEQVQGDGAGGPQQLLGSQIFLAQMPWGGPPGADLLQNIMTSVLRQGLPGMEGMLQGHIHIHAGQNQSPGANQNRTAQNENQTAFANTGRVGNQAYTENLNERREAGQQQSSESDTGSGSSNRPPHQVVSFDSLVYDRYMVCDSPHARFQLQRRREVTSQAGGPRLRSNSLERIQNQVERLFARLDWSARDEESLMVASVLVLREAISFSSGRTLTPSELYPVRTRLQVYVEEYLQGDPGSEINYADVIFERHAAFISRMSAITPIRPSVDLIASMRAVVCRFIDEAVSIFSGESNRIFVRKFRIILPRLFYELCGVISYCCLEGIRGLRSLYRSFMGDLIQNIDESVRDHLFGLSVENLNAAISRIESRRVHPGQFIRRRGQQPCTSSSVRAEQGPMDTTDTTETSDESQTEVMECSNNPYSPIDIYNCPTPPLAELAMSGAAGIVPTISTFVSAAPEAAISASATAVHTVPIVPTVTTIPNAPVYTPPPNPPRSTPATSTVSRLTSQRPRVATSHEPQPSSAYQRPTPVITQTQTCPPLTEPQQSTTSLSLMTPTTIRPTPTEKLFSQMPSAQRPRTSHEPQQSSAYMRPTPIVKTPPRPPMTEIPHSATLLSPVSDGFNYSQSTSQQAPSRASTAFQSPMAVFAQTPETQSVNYASSTQTSSQLFPSPIVPTFTQSAPTTLISTPPTQSSASAPQARPYSSPIVQTTPLRPIIIPGAPIRHAYIATPEATATQSAPVHIRNSAPVPSPFPGWGLNGLRCFPPHFHRGAYSAPISTTQLRHTRPYDGGRGRRIVQSTRHARTYEPSGSRAASSSYSSGSSYETQAEMQATSPTSSPRSEILYEPAPLYLRAGNRRHPHGRNTRAGSGRSFHGNPMNMNNSHLGRNSIPAPMPARQERYFIGNSYGNISYSRAPLAPSHPPNGYLQPSHSRGRSQRRDRYRSTRNVHPSPSDQGSSDSSTEFVPPAQIAQHWGEDWVPTFTRDLQRQSDSSEPLSDAYLSGMPPKKRRCLRQSRPPATLDRLISESISVLVEAPRGQGELRGAFREHVRAVTRSRAVNSDDYEPSRLQATANFLKQTRRKIKPSENASGSK